MGFNSFGFGYGGGFLMPVMMIAVWSLFIVGAVYLVRALIGTGGGRTCKTDSPLEALKLRYAKGEINSEDYERIRKEIQ